MEKLETEFMRIVDAKEAESDGEALLKAAAALGSTKSSARKAKTVIIG